MRKIWAFLLLGMFSLCGTSAEAKVCFLPNVLIGGKCVALSSIKHNDCKGFTETTPCEEIGKETIETCSIGDKTFYKCGCRGDVISWDVINEHEGWICESGYSQECGCSSEHIRCTSEYRYLGDGTGKCATSTENENSKGYGACDLPNGRIYYKDCRCDGYPYECDGLTGLKAPTGADDDSVGCLSPHNNFRKYKECECEDGWTRGSCESNTNGCLMPITYVTANDGDLTCALCDERLCKANGQLNLETVYCEPKDGGAGFGGAYLNDTITDCVRLGFVQGATGGYCPAGTQKAGEKGLKCPFNSEFMFCEDKEGCYPTEDMCKDKGFAQSCTDTSGCYRVSECKAGYKLDLKTGSCVRESCEAGYEADNLDCNDLEHGYTGQKNTEGYSGEIACEKCVCDINAARANDYCIYTIDGENGTTVIGEGTPSELCCDGKSYAKCEFTRGSTSPIEGAKSQERYEACGEVYYIAMECYPGYELKNGYCENQSCGGEYSSNIQSVEDCASEGLYTGATGWEMETEYFHGKAVMSGDKICHKCTCEADESCKWDNSNKGEFGYLEEEYACCNGMYQRCIANMCKGTDDTSGNCIPSSASVALCSSKPLHAVSMKEYKACGQKTRCLVNQCEKGYRPSDDKTSCVEKTSCDNVMLFDTCPRNSVCSNVGECQKVTGCDDGFKLSSNKCVAKTCNDYSLSSSCPSGRIPSPRSVKLGSTTGICYECIYNPVTPDPDDPHEENEIICSFNENRFNNWSVCNIVTGSDCTLDDDGCYTTGEPCASYEDSDDNPVLQTPCNGDPDSIYPKKCGRYWTGECVEKGSYLMVQPIVFSSIIWDGKELEQGSYFLTIDEIHVPVHLLDGSGKEVEAESEPIGMDGGVFRLSDLDGSPTEEEVIMPYYISAELDNSVVDVVVSYHKMGNDTEIIEEGGFDRYISEPKLYENGSVTLLTDNTVVINDHVLGRGTIKLPISSFGNDCEFCYARCPQGDADCYRNCKTKNGLGDEVLCYESSYCEQCLTESEYDLDYPTCGNQDLVNGYQCILDDGAKIIYGSNIGKNKAYIILDGLIQNEMGSYLGDAGITHGR